MARVCFLFLVLHHHTNADIFVMIRVGIALEIMLESTLRPAILQRYGASVRIISFTGRDEIFASISASKILNS